MEKKFKAAIFDLDGVICSTDEYHYLAWKALADREGIYFDKVINNRLRGVSRMESLNIVLEKASKTYSEEQKIEMATFKNDHYREFLLKMSPSDLSENVKNTLSHLKEKGIKIAIGSSSKNTKTILTQLGILDWFDQIADGNDIKNSKPDPEVFLCAQTRLGLSVEECIVVEDALAGIDAAKAGGFFAVGIQDAAKYKKTDYGIKELSDILNLF
jgi:beta-phosphoglucomutase